MLRRLTRTADLQKSKCLRADLGLAQLRTRHGVLGIDETGDEAADAFVALVILDGLVHALCGLPRQLFAAVDHPPDERVPGRPVPDPGEQVSHTPVQVAQEEMPAQRREQRRVTGDLGVERLVERQMARHVVRVIAEGFFQVHCRSRFCVAVHLVDQVPDVLVEDHLHRLERRDRERVRQLSTTERVMLFKAPVSSSIVEIIRRQPTSFFTYLLVRRPEYIRHKGGEGVVEDTLWHFSPGSVDGCNGANIVEIQIVRSNPDNRAILIMHLNEVFREF